MSAPVRHTCPDIDRVIKHIKEALKTAENGRKQFKGQDADDFFYYIIDNLDGLERDLEGLRSDNDELRKWGHELEKEVNRLENEVDRLDQEASLATTNG